MVGSIPVSILLSCQSVRNVALLLHKHAYSWVLKIRNTSEAVPGLGQYNSLGEYFGPHTASSVFLIYTSVYISSVALILPPLCSYISIVAPILPPLYSYISIVALILPPLCFLYQYCDPHTAPSVFPISVF